MSETRTARSQKPPSAGGKPRPLAVILPGMMGSWLTLAQDAGAVAEESTSPEQVVWSDDVSQIYKLLADNPDVLRFNGTPFAAPKIITRLRLQGIPIKWLYRRLDKYLAGHPTFSAPDGVLRVPYDWRDDLVNTSARVSRQISSYTNFDYANAGAPRRLVFITHSMGALVVRLALAERNIDISNVAAIVHLAPPLLGSGRAFRAAYGRNALPMLSPLVAFARSKKNGEFVLERLSEMLRTFPSLYQLMPPVSETFMQTGSGEVRSPFEPREAVIPELIKERVEYAHVQLSRFPDLARVAQLPTFSICGGLGNSDTDRRYHVFRDPDRYRVLGDYEPERERGDKTVSLRSASRDNSEPDFRVCPGVDHDNICNHGRAIALVRAILQGQLWTPPATS